MELKHNTDADIQPGAKGIFQLMRERRQAAPRYFGQVRKPQPEAIAAE